MKKIKSIIVAFIIFSSLFGIGCQEKRNNKIDQSQVTSPEIDNKVESHLCGALTKQNKGCKNKVRNDKGKFCHLHKGQE